MRYLGWLVAVLGTLFGTIGGVEIGRGDMQHLYYLQPGEHYRLRQQVGVYVQLLGRCDVEPPADCRIFQLVSLDMTQAAVMNDPLPWPTTTITQRRTP